MAAKRHKMRRGAVVHLWASLCCMSFVVLCGADTHYVSLTGGHVSPYTNWVDAATNIQAAIDASTAGDTVLVTNGAYQLTNELVVSQGITVQSVNGYLVTVLFGAGTPYRCLHVDHATAVVDGFTITGGRAGGWYEVVGGGVRLEQGLLSRCAVTGNTASIEGWGVSAYGGGVHASASGKIRSCLIEGNQAVSQNSCGPSPGGTMASSFGGGVYGGIVENCTIVGNTVDAGACLAGDGFVMAGAGVYNSSIENTIVWGNHGATNWASLVAASYSCSFPLMPGTGNTTNDPLFVGAGDYHLRSSSTSSDSGVNQSWMSAVLELDGLPRILGGQVNRGCFEQARDASLDAPAVSVPVPVAAGGTNTAWMTNTAVTVSGAKPTGSWVVVRSPMGGFTTNGVEQYAGSSAWAYAATVSWGAGVETRAVSFRCAASADFASVSASTTVLRLRNTGFGAPRVCITNTQSAVGYTATNYCLGGTNTADTVGNIRVSNAVNGATAVITAPEPPLTWAAPALALDLGTNILSACGSNLLGDAVCDSLTVVRGGLGTPFTWVTSMPVMVDFGVGSIAPGGSNNLHVAGQMAVSNNATGGTLSFAAPVSEPFRWTSPAVALVPGTNVLSVACTNLAGEAATSGVTVTLAGAGDPSVAITSLPRSYTFGITNAVLGGSNNAHVVGRMWLTNLQGHCGVSFPVSSVKPYRWTSPSFPLAEGLNEIIVYGSNALGSVESHAISLTRTAGTVHYVRRSGSTPAAPYDTWETAAESIDSALWESGPGETILVDTGTYGVLVLDQDVHIRSLAGPRSTAIACTGYDCESATLAVVDSSNALLEGFTLSGAHRYVYAGDPPGGGLRLCRGTVRNCVISSNIVQGYTWDYVQFGQALGGGAYVSGGRLENCLVWANNNAGGITILPGLGGGVYCVGGEIVNCTIVENSSGEGSGIYLGDKGTVANSIVVSNSNVWGGGDIARYTPASNVSYCCSPMAPSGYGNLSLDPVFVGGGDFRLSRNSPCVDRGFNQGWMTNSVELDYKPRLLNSVVDMGAYEAPYLVMLRAVVQGAYVPGASSMRVNLRNEGAIPLSAPYLADRLFVATIPTNAVDWVLVAFHETPESAPAIEQSAFLTASGDVVRADGTPGLVVDAQGGQSLYVSIGHRNHLTVMSAEPLLFNEWTRYYDFTTGSAQYYGGTNAAVELEPGVWGMIAGDADGDGKITWVDRAVVSNQVGKTGYLSGDLNLDGVVTDGE